MKTAAFALLTMLCLTGCGATEVLTDEEGEFEVLDAVEQDVITCSHEGSILWIRMNECCRSSDPNSKRMQRKRKLVCRGGIYVRTTRTRCEDSCAYN